MCVRLSQHNYLSASDAVRSCFSSFSAIVFFTWKHIPVMEMLNWEHSGKYVRVATGEGTKNYDRLRYLLMLCIQCLAFYLDGEIAIAHIFLGKQDDYLRILRSGKVYNADCTESLWIKRRDCIKSADDVSNLCQLQDQSWRELYILDRVSELVFWWMLRFARWLTQIASSCKRQWRKR